MNDDEKAKLLATIKDLQGGNVQLIDDKIQLRTERNHARRNFINLGKPLIMIPAATPEVAVCKLEAAICRCNHDDRLIPESGHTYTAVLFRVKEPEVDEEYDE